MFRSSFSQIRSNVLKLFSSSTFWDTYHRLVFRVDFLCEKGLEVFDILPSNTEYYIYRFFTISSNIISANFHTPQTIFLKCQHSHSQSLPYWFIPYAPFKSFRQTLAKANNTYIQIHKHTQSHAKLLGSHICKKDTSARYTSSRCK